jgi:two-component system chemotaxis response regulator CheY
MKRKIIVVDDSLTIRQHVRFTLERCGYEVLEAVNGQEGLTTIKKNPDLAMAIVDINMPLINGIELTAQVKGMINGQLPIIVLTTEGSADLIEKAKAAGATAYMVKPFIPEQLEAVARKIAGSPDKP